jgi:hypothetical protein
LHRQVAKRKPAPPDPAVTARLADAMPEVEDEALRQALARLGASIKRK